MAGAEVELNSVSITPPPCVHSEIAAAAARSVAPSEVARPSSRSSGARGAQRPVEQPQALGESAARVDLEPVAARAARARAAGGAP